MSFWILRARSDSQVASHISSAYEITVHDIGRKLPDTRPLANAEGIIALPKAVRQLRTSHGAAERECLQDIQQAIKHGAALINLISRSVADSPGGDGAFTLTSDLRIPVTRS